MDYEPYRQGSLLIPHDDIPHLFAVMNDPCPERLCLIIMITSIRPKRFYDKACTLNAGDHPFIKHPSYLLYRIARMVLAPHISKMVGKHLYVRKEDLAPSVYNRIVKGLWASDELPLTIAKYARSVNIEEVPEPA